MDDIKRFWGHYERATDQFGGRWSIAVQRIHQPEVRFGDI